MNMSILEGSEKSCSKEPYLNLCNMSFHLLPAPHQDFYNVLSQNYCVLNYIFKKHWLDQ